MRKIDLSGHTFGHWTVVRACEPKNKETYWLCRCTCGAIREVGSKNLRCGRSISCGCATKELHGESNSVEYSVWRHMLDRCSDPGSADWRLYGGRGITVEWNCFADFLRDMGRRPSAQHSIDRYPDKSGPYSKYNCRWATPKEQARNTRVNRMISALGKTLCLAEWAELTGLSRNCIEKRIDALGWTAEEAVTMPLRSKPPRP